jgi:hypothetical protein
MGVWRDLVAATRPRRNLESPRLVPVTRGAAGTEGSAVDISNPGNDRSLTADEAQAWKVLERSLRLRLRPRLRYRAAALVSRLGRNPVVLAGFILTLSAGLVALAVVLPVAGGLIVATGAASVGVCLLVVRVLQVTQPRLRRHLRRRPS